MKGTDAFKQTIQNHLEFRSQTDVLFAETYKKENKNIDDCVTYILNQVKDSGNNGFTDDEIFGMAVHYYDEDNIKVGNKIHSGSVVVNHHVELTEEEKAEAKDKAIRELIDENKRKVKHKTTPAIQTPPLSKTNPNLAKGVKKQAESNPTQPTLF